MQGENGGNDYSTKYSSNDNVENQYGRKNNNSNCSSVKAEMQKPTNNGND